ncbi:invertase, partial [Pseudomonas avellanae]
MCCPSNDRFVGRAGRCPENCLCNGLSDTKIDGRNGGQDGWQMAL